jgi:hypothetical protein
MGKSNPKWIFFLKKPEEIFDDKIKVTILNLLLFSTLEKTIPSPGLRPC